MEKGSEQDEQVAYIRTVSEDIINKFDGVSGMAIAASLFGNIIAFCIARGDIDGDDEFFGGAFALLKESTKIKAIILKNHKEKGK